MGRAVPGRVVGHGQAQAAGRRSNRLHSSPLWPIEATRSKRTRAVGEEVQGVYPAYTLDGGYEARGGVFHS